jgi:predicted small secreted protein
MKFRILSALVIVGAFSLTGCGDEKEAGSGDSQSYSQCLETEAAKLLDETGSNLDYANEKAAELCADKSGK